MIHFTADLHLGCDKLVQNTRKIFSDIGQHDEHLIDQINSNVDRRDTLVIVGDFCKEKPGRYRPLIRCRNIHFILGNHDNEHKTRAVFGGNVWQQRMVKVGIDRVWCSHFPTAFWDRSHYGVAHAYGHLHYNLQRERQMDQALPGRKSMDVGVDAAMFHLSQYRPFTSEEFFDILKDRPGHDIIKKEDRWNEKDFS